MVILQHAQYVTLFELWTKFFSELILYPPFIYELSEDPMDRLLSSRCT